MKGGSGGDVVCQVCLVEVLADEADDHVNASYFVTLLLQLRSVRI